MNNQNYIGIALDELYRMFFIHNKRWFRDSLPAPVITIQSAGRKAAYGWFSVEKIWDKNGGTPEESKHEINICAEHLGRSIVEVAETLQHEMVHYYDKLSDIKDHADNVHNKRFKQQAERAGLQVAFSPKYGWGYTTATPEFEAFVLNDVEPNPECFLYFRNVKLGSKDKKEAEKKTFIYTCPQCIQKIKGPKDISAICGLCHVSFEMEEV